MTGDDESVYFLASDAGYGFMARLQDLYARNKNGKVVLSVPKGAQVLPPAPVFDPEEDYIAAVSSSGRLLVCAIAEFPLLGKGKGLKYLQIPPAKLKAREEFVVALTVFSEGDAVQISAGKRNLTLKPAVLDEFYAERGLRGKLLPRGFRQVSAMQCLKEPTPGE